MESEGIRSLKSGHIAGSRQRIGFVPQFFDPPDLASFPLPYRRSSAAIGFVSHVLKKSIEFDLPAAASLS
jgi:hypothetical protein